MKKITFWSMMMLMSLALPTMVACGNDNDDEEEEREKEEMIDTTPISFYSDGKKVIAGADTIVSSNTYVVYAKGNEVFGYHIGEAELLVNNKKTIQVKVLPRHHIYDDPICKWGCDRNYVESNQKQGTLVESTPERLEYHDVGNAMALYYYFNNNKLSGVATLVSTLYTTAYAEYFAERFLMLPDYEGENTYFVGIDALEEKSAKTAVVMEVYNDDYIMAMYMPVNELSTRSPQIIDWAEEVKTIIENLSL